MAPAVTEASEPVADSEESVEDAVDSAASESDTNEEDASNTA